ncbi:MAG: hypothetical protein HY316_04165 [Acidobacteria bacterium]|nr:hypothetical protein [Acidobacteriota bacterium]
MNLKDAVEKYLAVAGHFGEPMPLGQFGLPRAEAEAMLSAWDEDYHLHRHFELVPASWMSEGAPAYSINGVLYAAIVIQESIREALEGTEG